MPQNTGMMPSPVDEIYQPLFQRVSWLHTQWNEWVQLYAQSQQTVGLLNQTAPAFFWMVQTAMLERILLTITKLTDPAETGRKENLSLARLVQTVDANSHSQARKELNQAIKFVQDQSSLARDARNRIIAHDDLPTAQQKAQPVSALIGTTQYIDSILANIRLIMNTVEKAYGVNPVSYEAVIPPLGGVKNLVNCIENAAELWRRHTPSSKTLAVPLSKDE